MPNQEIDQQELLGFIAKAHRHTYAAPKEVRKQHKLETPFLPGHKCYYFKDGEFEYYQGKNNEDYSADFFQNEAFPFLKRALVNMDDSMPFRGPREFVDGDFKYVFELRGDYQYFTGREVITHKVIEVFFQ